MHALNLAELMRAEQAILDAEPCEIHGRAFLEVCLDCCDARWPQVWCAQCEPQGCQCWNDE